MKTFKLILALLIVGFAALFVWENLSTFQSTLSFTLDLYIRKQTWNSSLYTTLGIAFALGLLVGVLLTLKPHFKLRRRLVQERLEKNQLLAAQEAAKPEKQASTVIEAQPEPSTSAPVASADPKPEHSPAD